LAQIKMVKAKVAARQEPYYSAYRQLLHDADSVSAVGTHALADFSVPGYYVEPEKHKANSLALQQDAYGAYCSALAFALSGEAKYGEKACSFLDAWASVNKGYSGHDGILVLSYSGSGLLMAAELMSGSPVWGTAGEQRFKDWVKNVYLHAVDSIRVHQNNWADWGRFGSMLAASLSDDRAEIEENVRLIKSDLSHKIAADGSMPEETRRGDNGIWYTYFSLAPMTGACWLVYNLTGENLFEWEKDGVSIKKALEYLAYYNHHPSEWKWAEKPNTGEKELWPANLLEAMSSVYGDASFAEYDHEKQPIFYRTHHFCWTFPTLMPVMLKYEE
ncbi:MAG: alginate lyase family protein, partial [Paraprevotella sp.]|nr:alginate lyase family protein [Paraprevotella sp.]